MTRWKGQLSALAIKYLQNSEHIHKDWVMEKETCHQRSLLAMSRVFSNTGTGRRVIAASSLEAIFDLCHLPAAEVGKHEKAVAEMASRGLVYLELLVLKFQQKTCPQFSMTSTLSLWG